MKKVEFTVDFDELSLWNQEMKKVVEPGDFEVQVRKFPVKTFA